MAWYRRRTRCWPAMRQAARWFWICISFGSTAVVHLSISRVQVPQNNADDVEASVIERGGKGDHKRNAGLCEWG